MEFACKISGSKLIVVLRHTNCGAIEGVCNDIDFGYVSLLLQKIKPAIEQETITKSDRTGSNKSIVMNVTINNIFQTVNKIRERRRLLVEMEEKNQIKIISGFYDVDNGKVVFYE
jgi:carbonic anhydrase